MIKCIEAMIPALLLFGIQHRRMAAQQSYYYQIVPVVSNSGGTSKSNYAERWDECEYYSSILDDNGVGHDELSYGL